MGSDIKQRMPSDFKQGSRFTFDGRTWVVTEYTVSPGQGGYDERQWTIQDEQNQAVAYLLACESDDNGFNSERWEFTRQLVMSEVSNTEDNGRPFAEQMMPRIPPKEVSCRGQLFTLKESYTTKAEDDEGNTVPKETWDYFDSTGVRNLAFEIWKEPDRDYPEVYLGNMIDPAGLVYAGSKTAVALKGGNGLWGGLMVVGVLFISGVPGDLLLSFALPAMALAVAFSLSLVCSLVVLAGAAINSLFLLTFFFNMPGLFIGVITVGLVTGSVVLAASMNNDIAPHILWISGLAAFISTIIYSFIVYFRFAPAPHNVAQLGAVVLLPVVIAGTTALVNGGLRYLWPSIESNA